jgi:hypothetical protein
MISSLMKKSLLFSMSLNLIACGPGVNFSAGNSGPSSQSNSGSNGGPANVNKNATHEKFNQQSASAVDILMVIDNSPSMQQFQDKIAPGFSNLIASLQGIDWQIAFTTTDRFTGNLYSLSNGDQVLTSKTPGAFQVFQNTILGIGEAGSPDERGIKAANSIIAAANGASSSFFRANASLALVFLSDEDERSTGGNNSASYAHNGNGWSGPIELEDEVNHLIETKTTMLGSTKPFSAYSIVIEPGDISCYDNDQFGLFGTFYRDITDKTGGVMGSICDADYTHTLKNISASISKLVKSVSLSHVPDSNTVKVTIVPAQSDITFTVEGKTVVFSREPDAGSQIDVSYVYESEDTSK